MGAVEILGSAGWLITAARYVAAGLELAGVAVILVSVIAAGAGYIRTGVAGDWAAAYDKCRANLGRGILLGLELLVGADIIATVTAPLTFESVGLLAVVVLIRTFLSFALETEIEGQWPWDRRSAERSHPEPDAKPARSPHRKAAAPR